MAIERYVVLPNVDASLGEATEEYETYGDARRAAKPGNAIVALIYEFTDSELVEVIPGEDSEDGEEG